ncbi:hypothetical protein WAI453_012607 [Rhynchosporium graminicola]
MSATSHVEIDQDCNLAVPRILYPAVQLKLPENEESRTAPIRDAKQDGHFIASRDNLTMTNE